MSTQTAYERVINALYEHGSKVIKKGDNNAQAQCPAHDDRNPSLSVTNGDRNTLVYCHAGCDTNAVLDALKLQPADLYDNPREHHYTYSNADGSINRYVSRRIKEQDRRKTLKRFSQKVPDGNIAPVLYRLNEVIEAVKNGQPIYLVEGEKDADNGHKVTGECFTTAPQGATNVHLVDFSPLKGASVTAIVDKDPAGDKWAQKVEEHLRPIAGALAFTHAQHGKDLSDHIAAGGSVDTLEPYTPPKPSKRKTPPPQRRITCTPLSETQSEPVTFLWDGLIPSNKVTIFAGYGGCGKSTFALHTAARVTRGTLPGVHEGKPRTVLIFQIEDGDASEWRPRFIVNDGDPALAQDCAVEEIDPQTGNVYRMSLRLPSDLDVLEQTVAQYYPALIIIDPLSACLEGKNDDAQDVQFMLHRLGALAVEHECAVVGIVHTRKGGGRAQDAINGSGQWRSAARSVLLFAEADGYTVVSLDKLNNGARKQKDYRFTLTDTPECDSEGQPVIMNGIPVSAARVTGWGASDVSYEEVVNRAPLTQEQAEEERDAVEWLKDRLAHENGIPDKKLRKEFQELFGRSDRTYRRAKKTAGVKMERAPKFGGEMFVYSDGDFYRGLIGGKNDHYGHYGETTPTFPQDTNDSPLWPHTGQNNKSGHYVTTMGKPHDSNEKPVSDSHTGHSGHTGHPTTHNETCPACGTIMEKFEHDWRCPKCTTES
ncbi:AAA family ATPase [Arcanobacterium canis]